MFDFYAFLRKKWSEYSNATGQKGTVIDELAVKPTGLVMSDFNNMLVSQRRVNNISEWKNMTDDELNFFGNKFFFPRIDGDYTFGNIRIWFDEKKDITISQDARFGSTDGYKFKAVQPGFVSKSSFKTSTDSFALFYVDVPIIAESKGNQFNVTIGKITNISNINFTYKMVSNLEDMQNGSKYETNEEYYNRLVQSINDRSMMTKRSIFSRLPEFFPVISSMYIAAPGDKYMKRDLISGMDVSRPIQRVDYLGKITGENIIKNIAFYGIFPPNAGSLQKEAWGPFSVLTRYDTPLTISPTDLTASIAPPKRSPTLADPSGSTIFSGQTGDPGLHGFPLDQEMDIDQYKGMYFDDYKTFTEIETTDLWNILDEDIGITPIIVPDSTWIYGAHGKTSGDLGEMYDSVDNIDILNFQNNSIKLSGGFKSNAITVGKDIEKRIGIKISGTLTFPEVTTDGTYPDHSNLQIMVGGVNNTSVEGYTGIGFGIRLNGVFNPSDINETNAILYFAHSEKYETAQVFATDYDETDHISITDLGALAEKPWRIEGGQAYDFEFVINDDLRVTLYLNRQVPTVNPDSTNLENKFYFKLDKTVLNVYSKELFSKTTTHYGTMAKVTLEADGETATDIWQIDDLKFVDLQQSRSLALLAMDMKDIESPIDISVRAFGNGSVNNTQSDGYSLFIWDKEKTTSGSGSTELTSGGWSKLNDISNPTGSKDVLTSLLSQSIDNLDRYLVESRFGTNIFIMIASTGTSQASSLFSGDTNDDIKSRLRIDYVKIESQSMYLYHANNKSDIYVSTIKNSEELETTSILLSKSPNDNFFVMDLDAEVKMPVEDIISVTIGASTVDNEPLSDTEYTIVRPDELLRNSSREEIRLYLNDYDSDEITVEYTTFPEVSRIQDFFDGTEFGKIYGDMLVKHKSPILLNFTIFFTGDINNDQLVDEIRKYIDNNIDGIFSTRELASYLYNEEFVNNIQEPIEVNYSRYDENGEIVTGTFTDSIVADDNEFFRINNLSVSRL